MILNYKDFEDYKEGDTLICREYDNDYDFDCNISTCTLLKKEGSNIIIRDEYGEEFRCSIKGFYAIGNHYTSQYIVLANSLGYTQYIDQRLKDLSREWFED